MIDKKVIGQSGEMEAKKFLENLGYTILETNWRYKQYELDIIASDDYFIVAVEVKTRKSEDYGSPETFVSLKKQRHLIKAINQFVFQRKLNNEIRFDVIAITYHNDNYSINHLKDAFYPII